MRVLEFVKMVNGFFSGLTTAGLTVFIHGVTKNNVYAQIEGLIMLLAGAPIAVFSAITWYLMKQEKEGKEKE